MANPKRAIGPFISAAIMLLCPATTVAQVASAAVVTLGGSPQQAPAPQSDSADLAQKLTNPVASLISVPFQSNFDLRCWATTPSGGPQGCGLRFIFTPLCPKG